MTAGRRATVAGVAVVGAVIAAYAYAESRLPRSSDSRPTADPDVVAVFPFSVTSAQPALSDLRDAIQDLIAARLTLVDASPRALDPAAVLDALRRAAPSTDGVAPLDVLLSVAAELGAGQLLHGEVAGTPDQLSIEAVLAAVPGGAVRARARVQASADSLPYFADRLAARLLAVRAARDSDELAALAGTSLPALRAYLAGLHAHSRGKCCTPSEAQEHFERALFLDSTFPLAALRLAETAPWGMAELEERWRLDAIWNQRDRLGPADRALLFAYLGPRYPRPATPAELIASAEQAALTAPHRLEGWRIAGRSLFELGPLIGYPRSEARAREALQHALALDSTDALTLQYLLRLAAAAGDRAAVRRYAGLYLAHNPGAYETESIRWLAALMLGDGAGLAALRSRLAEMHPFQLRALVEWSPPLGVGLDDADRATRVYEEGARSVGERRAVVVGVVPFLLNRGRPGEASRLLATAERGFGQRADVGVLEFRIYAALYWDGDSTEAAAAARSVEAYLDGAPVRLGYVRDPQTASCALAHWRLATGDLAGAEAALGRMRRLGPTTGSYSIEYAPLCAAAVEAQLASARDRPEAGAALGHLDSLLRVGFDRRYLLPSVANMIAARLSEACGDLVQALAIARRRNLWGNRLLSTQLREEGRLAALVGDTVGAVRAFRHYLQLRSDPEPVVRPEVERVRAELQRLEGRNAESM